MQLTRLQRQTSRLRLERISQAGACYFLTLCTQGRVPEFTEPAAANSIKTALESLNGDACLLHAATIMPDHVQLLFTLGSQLTISQVIGKLKILGRVRGQATWRWQANGFEHRLRTTETNEDYGFYIFMNPYRAKLLPVTQAWSGCFCPEPAIFRFMAILGPGATPPPTWLDDTKPSGENLTTGE
ncbi:MAG: transposase [Candidatus Synoicihabitans palmerolidicus]|nr:transposase [Candidatus Synoicihabitans palmerolidicus]